MSLKHIREALSLARARSGFGDTEEELKADVAAQAALDAIELACRTLGINGMLTVLEAEANRPEREAIAVLKAIAKEAE